MNMILTIGITSGVFVLTLAVVTKCIRLRMAGTVDRRRRLIPHDRRAVPSSYAVFENNDVQRLYPLTSMADIKGVPNAECSLYDVIDDTSILNFNTPTVILHSSSSVALYTNTAQMYSNDPTESEHQHIFDIRIPVNEYQNSTTLSEMSYQSLSNAGQNNLHVYDTPHDEHEIHRCDALQF